MRVLHIDTGWGWRGGQQQVLWLMEGARALGLEQVLLTPEGSELARRAAASAPHDKMKIAPLAAKILSLENIRKVRNAARGVDVVHAHDAHGHTLAWAAQKITAGGFPPLIVARRVTFPIRLLGRLKNRQPAWFMAVSHHIRLQLIASGIPAERVRVIHDGVRAPAELPSQNERRALRREQGETEDAFVMGTLSNFAPEKLLAKTVDLLAELPAHARFWLGVGEAQAQSREARELRELARARGVESRYRIIPVGPRTAPLLDSLDLFVYLSRSEGLGSAILLAMAHGLPVVASRVGGIPEIVRHEQTGLLVDAEHDDDGATLSAAVRRLMDSAEMRHRLGAQGREFVLADATSDKMVARTVAFYEEILSARRKERGQASA